MRTKRWRIVPTHIGLQLKGPDHETRLCSSPHVTIRATSPCPYNVTSFRVYAKGTQCPVKKLLISPIQANCACLPVYRSCGRSLRQKKKINQSKTNSDFLCNKCHRVYAQGTCHRNTVTGPWNQFSSVNPARDLSLGRLVPLYVPTLNLPSLQLIIRKKLNRINGLEKSDNLQSFTVTRETF